MTIVDAPTIDIDLNNKPFIGPKIKFKLNSVPESTSEISSVDKIINESSPITQELDRTKDDNQCNFELD